MAQQPGSGGSSGVSCKVRTLVGSDDQDQVIDQVVMDRLDWIGMTQSRQVVERS